MKLKEINRTAMLCWSPAQHHPIYLTTGTSAQQLDASFSTSASLELFELNLADPSLDMKSCGTFSSSQRYHKLVWSPFGIDGQGLTSGVLIAGGENGNVILYDPAKILSRNGNVIIAEGAMHTGPVRALDVNPFQTNLVASGGNESEVYIWDINNFKSPMTPGPKTQPLEDISCVAWNRQVQHILASTTPSGRTSVWDLRKNDLIIKVCDHSNRMHCSGMAWNPEVATQLLMASEDDRMPVIQMWDLRFASSPLKVLENHTRGVLGVAWSLADPELLLSCGKDGRILCWNPNTEEILYELPTGNQWCFDIQWCPRNPAVFSTAGFNSCIDIYSIMGGTSQAQSQRHVDQISTSFGNMDPFGTGQILPPLELPQSGSVSTTVTPLKKPPKWIRRPAGATFAFGGKLVSLEIVKPNPQQPGLHAVHVSQVVTETGLLKRSSQLQDTIHSGQFEEFCRGKINLTENEFEKTVWSFLRAYFDPDTRSSFLELLGYNKEQVALKISAALTEKPAEPVADLHATAEVNPEAAFDLIAAANLCPAAPELLSAQPPESVQSQEVKAEDKDDLFMDPNNDIVDHNQEADVSAEQQRDEEVIMEQEVNVMLNESKDLTYYSEPQVILSEDLQAPTEEPSQDLFQNELRAPMEEPAQDMFVQDLQAPTEEPSQDLFEQDLHAPTEEPAPDLVPGDVRAPMEEPLKDMFQNDLQAPMEDPVQYTFPVDLQAPIEEASQDLFPGDVRAPTEEPLQDLFENNLKASMEEPSQDLFEQDLQPPMEVPVPDMFLGDVRAPPEEPPQDLFENDLQPHLEEPAPDMFPVDLQPPLEEPAPDMFAGVPAEEPSQYLCEEDLPPSIEQHNIFPKDLPPPIEDLIAGGEMLQNSLSEVESFSEDPIEKVFQIPSEKLVIADVPRPSANDVTQITPEVNPNPGLSQDVDELITRALLTGNFEGAVELCLHDNRMADSIILALAGGAELLEKTQTKYFIKSPSKLSKLISAVVMKDLHAIMSTCELQNWKEALASVMTYADTQEFSSLCDLLGGRLEGANDLQLQAQASLCYICAGNLEKLVSCWIKAQERHGPLYLQDLVEKVVVMRHAVETQKSSPLAVGDLLAEKMSEYANLLASQGCLSTAVMYLPDEPNHVCVRLLRERLNCALSRQDPACSKTQSVACKVPPLQTPTAAQSNNPYSAVQPISTAPAPAQPHFYQPVRAASTVTSWSNQTPTAFPHVPTAAASDPSKVELPNPMCGMPTTENAAVPSVPFVPSHQYLPQVTQYPQGAGGPRMYRPDQYSSPVTPVLAEASAPPHPPGFLSQYSQHVPPQTSFTPFSSPSASFASPNLFTITSSSTNSAIPPPSIADFQHSGPGSPGSYVPLPPQNGFSAPQNGWNDPPTLVRGPMKKQVPEYYSPPAPITSPIMAPMGVDLQPPQTQVSSSGHQQPASPFINSMSTSASNASSEGAPGALVGDVIQPPQSLPSEQITKTIPEEHLLLKTTFESLIQNCLIVATDPQTKRKLVDANKRLETLYDKLSDRTLSPAIVGGLHNIAQSIDSRSYAEALKIHTHIVSSSNFSEISGFMPVLKVVLTQANRLGV
ncbi:unnamed protein product [Knipowitschia caucasica]